MNAAPHGRPKRPLPTPSHVGRTDVGDAGRSHTENPDAVSSLKAADSGYEPVVRTAHSGKKLALTFDDGPSDYTPQVLDLLKRYHIKATFCMVGENVTWYPQTVKRIVAEGHALCNHSMHHDDLGTVSPAAAWADIAATDAAIADGWTFDLPEVTQTAHALPSSSTPSTPPSTAPTEALHPADPTPTRNLPSTPAGPVTSGGGPAPTA